MSPAYSKYKGDAPRLVLAIDIGTTFSGVSYAILEPGKVPKVRPVTRYPDQERVGGDAKIPTVIYYDSGGKPRAIGAETLKQGIETEARAKGWGKAHWFKLLLRPSESSNLDSMDAETIPELPHGIPVLKPMTDLMEYLDRCAKTYISETHNAMKIQEYFGEDIVYVLAHPNGWGGTQQAQLRQAAVDAKLVLDTEEGHARILFVTEGEASLHYCLELGLELDCHGKRSGVLIVDAGGGTVDITAYQRVSRGRRFEECDKPTCHFQGSLFTTTRFEKHVTELLSRSRYEGDIPNIVKKFDESTKHLFSGVHEMYYIPFASRHENKPSLGVREGNLRVEGRVIAQFFEPSARAIIEAIEEHCRTADCELKSVFLVGGFSASRWLYNRVKAGLAAGRCSDLTVSRPDMHVNKAVSNGAVAFYLNNSVASRVARTTYGTDTIVDYRPSLNAHLQQHNRVREDPFTGRPVLHGFFDIILRENTKVKATREFRCDYVRTARDRSELKHVTAIILSYCGSSEKPVWVFDEPDHYPVVCTIEADTSLIEAKEKATRDGRKYYEIAFQISMLFGLTELKAQIVYKAGGKEQRGPAKVIYDPDVKEARRVCEDDDVGESSDGSDYYE